MRAYFPGKAFPPISITGHSCALDCAHCGGRYLAHMHPAQTPEALDRVLDIIHREGARGFLLSGGCDARGRVPVEGFLPAVRKWEGRGLIANIHVGLADEGLARAIAEVRPTAVSVDVIGDRRAIREVMGIDARPDDYLETFQTLRGAGLFVVPHITVGLNAGAPSGEEEAIRMLGGVGLPKLVMNVLVPTKGTRFEGARAVPPRRTLGMMALAREILPGTEIILGCMRPKGCAELEVAVLKGAADSIINPSSSVLKMAGVPVERAETCCAIPSRSA